MPLNNPPVTVIALCYNHGRFLEESLQSVVNQTYPNIELIIVDDFSGDNSREKILSFIKNNTNTQFIFNESNLGNCRSFNNALRIAKGEFIIDLSTDDVMVPERVFEQVKKFQKSSDKTGVVFTDGIYIDENSKPFRSGQTPKNQSITEGDIYQEFLKGSFLIPSSLMIRKIVLDELGGYDETLAYEDFDFWVRSSRNWEYAYVPKILSYQRIVSGSHSTSFYKRHNRLIPASVEVYKKAMILNRTGDENQAMLIKMRRTIIICVLTENFQAGKELDEMIENLNGHTFRSWFFSKILLLKLPFGLISPYYVELRRFLKFRL